MREIKFRAWDKMNKKMGFLDHPFDENWYTIPSVYGSFPAQVAFTNKWEGKGAPDNYEIMTYTGMKDRNGNDIYEGDIVETDVMDYNGKAVVAWDENHYSIEWNGFKTGLYQPHRETWGATIIGNIYENPELMEVDQ